MDGDTVTDKNLESRGLGIQVVQLKSRIEELKVNRDALFEENKRLRSVVVADVEEAKELNNEIKELRSMHEGKMDGAHEVITQLEVEVARQLKRANSNDDQLCWIANWCKMEFGVDSDSVIGEEDWPDVLVEIIAKTVDDAFKPPEGLGIEIVQISGEIYYWVLVRKDKQLAHSRKVDVKGIIEPEANEVAAQLRLPVIVNERK